MDLNYAKEFIVGLVLIAFVGATAALALNSFYDDVKVDKVTSANESIATSGNYVVENALFAASSSCTNGTNTFTIGTHCNISSTGQVTFSVLNFTGVAFINYTYYTPTTALNISKQGLLGIDNSSDFFDTYGTIIGVAIIIGLILTAFVFFKR